MNLTPLSTGWQYPSSKRLQGDRINLPSVKKELSEGSPITVNNITKGKTTKMVNSFTAREIKILMAGGLLNLYR